MSTVNYDRWTARYSGEGFDRTQALAVKLTAEDRKAGRLAPACGYSEARLTEADGIVRAAQV